jgi:hypothetical protein
MNAISRRSEKHGFKKSEYPKTNAFCDYSAGGRVDGFASGN